MSENHIKFLRYTPESFAGIDKEMKLVVFFPDKEKIIAFEGDQGTTKTSNLACLKALLGGEEVANAINKKDNDKRASLEIEVNNNKYEARFTRTGFSVTLIQEIDGKPIKSNISQPKTFLQNLIGPIASNPMPLKDMDGKRQIEWIRKIFPLAENDLKIEKDAKEKFDEHYKKRTDANRDVKNKKQDLLNTGYYKWDEENKTFVASDLMRADAAFIKANPEDVNAINSMAKEASMNVSRLMAAKDKIQSLQQSHSAIQNKMADLERQLAEQKRLLEENEAQQKTGNEFIETLANAKNEWEQIQEKLKIANEITLKKERISQANMRHAEYEKLVQKQQDIQNVMDSAKDLIAEVIKKSTPDIEGLEVIIPTDIDSQDSRPEGIYYKGHSMQELCESEIWDMYMQVCDKSGTKVIMIENVQSLGTDAIARINQLAANGATVFGSIMDRSIKNPKVSFYEELK